MTGASGFVGRHLVPTLRDAGHAVEEHSTAAGDIASCHLPFRGLHAVIHLAGRTYVPASWRQTREFYEVNVLGTVNVLELCRRECASLVYVSSYVYGHPRSLPIAEDHPVAAVNPYAHTKLLAEDACRFYESQFGIPVSIMRVFNVYGPGQSEHFLIPALVRQALSADCNEIRVSDDRPRRDFVYIRDVVNLMIRMIGDPHPGVYNVGCGISHSVGDIVSIINDVLGTSKPIRSTNDERIHEIADVRADISRVSSTFGWRPEFGLRDGILRVVDAARH